MSDFATLLRRHREAKRWNQERCAEKCQMDHSLLSRLERDERGPTRDNLAKLCAGLGLALHDADELWIAAGRIPPNLDTNLLGRLIAFIREASTTPERAA